MLAAAASTLAPRLKRITIRKPIIENIVFKLHYQMTVTMLIAFVILVCAREYFGEHIRCMSDNAIPQRVIENYCFFMATFTIVRHYNESLLEGEFLPHPGVGPILESDETLNHTYYQWVPFVLFIQAICFYIPHSIWKKKEGGRIHALVQGLQYASLALENDDMKVGTMDVPSKKTINERIDIIRKDIILRLKITQTWSVWLVSMELLNFLHVMFQIWLINKFLNGHFIGLGPRVLSYRDWEHRIADPLETVFPKVTKCVFHKFGPSGSIQQHDALCVMALNIIHEKIYSVLWFWLLFLFIASFLAIVWRAITYFAYRRSLRFNQVLLKRANVGKFEPINVIRVVNGCQFGDWLFLYYLAKNMEGIIFQQLLVTLAKELQASEIPSNGVGNEEPGADDPVLMDTVNYDDETLPLQEKKSS
ncbi:unnamed protein product [Arctia plantaginis]|uniref:Innexin n=1 Tax=Arctia plantaginis TaxID=874455 RepID=A0A8S0YQL7_ARCPL|nr:unnamed protein product [Arctia plantaginis]